MERIKSSTTMDILSLVECILARSRALGRKNGRMVVCITGCTRMMSLMEMVCFSRVMEVFMLGILWNISFVGKELLRGKITNNTRVNGKIIKCTGKAFLIGQMDVDMMANTEMEKRRDLEFMFGLRGRSTREIGRMESKMDLEC